MQIILAAPAGAPRVDIAAAPAHAATDDIEVRVLSTAADFAALAIEWERLHDEATVASVFNSWMFQYAWWDLHGRPPLRLLAATRDMRTIGILPLYVRTESVMGLPVRVLRNIGNGGYTNPDDLGPLLAPGEEALAARALARRMVTMGGYDVACLDDMDARCRFAIEAAYAIEKERKSVALTVAERIQYVDLPADWETYLASLSAHRRANLRHGRNRLAKAHRARFFVWDDAKRLDVAAARLAELHRKRFGDTSESFTTPEYNALHLAAMKDALLRDRLRLYCLELDGRIAAMHYCFRFRNRIFMMQTGFDPAYAKLSPGTVLLGYAIEHAIKEGNEIFDFLRGHHRYKDELSTGSRQTMCLTAFRATFGAAAYRTRRHYLPAAKSSVQGFAQRLVATGKAGRGAAA